MESPLTKPPYRAKQEVITELEAFGIKPPRLYSLGFPHNNCGGMCVKAGIKQFILLYRTMPGRYKWHEQQEKELQASLGKDVTILQETRNGIKRRLPLETLRRRIESEDSEQLAPFDDWGGCGCFSDIE